MMKLIRLKSSSAPHGIRIRIHSTMSNYKQRKRRKLVRGSSILRVFGSSYRFKDEAKEERASRRRGQGHAKTSKLQISTRYSVHTIITPMGNKR